MFQLLSSCPAAMEAVKAADGYGLVPGHKTEQAGAVMAYTQSKSVSYTHLTLPTNREV